MHPRTACAENILHGKINLGLAPDRQVLMNPGHTADGFTTGTAHIHYENQA